MLQYFHGTQTGGSGSSTSRNRFLHRSINSARSQSASWANSARAVQSGRGMPIRVRYRNGRTECPQHRHLHRGVPLCGALRMGGVALSHECGRRRDITRKRDIRKRRRRARYYSRRMARGGYSYEDTGRQWR